MTSVLHELTNFSRGKQQDTCRIFDRQEDLDLLFLDPVSSLILVDCWKDILLFTCVCERAVGT